MRNLSLSHKSYWLPSLLDAGLLLPLPLRPWESFSSSELSIATRRGLFRERNLTLDSPRLYASARITWPFSRRKTSVEGGVPLGAEARSGKPTHDVCISSSHVNGEWFFALSEDFIFRVVHVRTAALVLEERLYSPDNWDFEIPSTYSIENFDDFETRVAAITPYNLGEKNGPFRSTLSVYTLMLDPVLVTATMELISQIPSTISPKFYDIAGDYAILVEDEEDWEECGSIHVFNWKTGKDVHLPPVRH